METYSQVYRKIKAANNLCADCGKVPPVILGGKSGKCQKCRDIKNEYNKKYLLKIKQICYDHYGNKCVCCGEQEPAFLSMDHIDNNGAEHRGEQGTTKGSAWLYLWLIRNNFPLTFQILCMNCNWGKRTLGRCPHQVRIALGCS